jgi:hypothetical protein
MTKVTRNKTGKKKKKKKRKGYYKMCKVVTINPEGHLKNKLLSLAKALIT